MCISRIHIDMCDTYDNDTYLFVHAKVRVHVCVCVLCVRACVYVDTCFLLSRSPGRVGQSTLGNPQRGATTVFKNLRLCTLLGSS